MIIIHNPSCSKSREAFSLLEESNCEFETRNYMKDKFSREELNDLLKKLNIKPSQLVRSKEAKYKELFTDTIPSEARILTAMLKFPQLIERPIVIQNGKAIIGRPTQLIVDFIEKK